MIITPPTVGNLCIATWTLLNLTALLALVAEQRNALLIPHAASNNCTNAVLATSGSLYSRCTLHSVDGLAGSSSETTLSRHHDRSRRAWPGGLGVKGKETNAVASTAVCELTRFAQALHPSSHFVFTVWELKDVHTCTILVRWKTCASNLSIRVNAAANAAPAKPKLKTPAYTMTKLHMSLMQHKGFRCTLRCRLPMADAASLLPPWCAGVAPQANSC